MKYTHAVIQDGIFYETGTDVPELKKKEVTENLTTEQPKNLSNEEKKKPSRRGSRGQ